MAQCSALKPDGTPCRVAAMRDSEFCWSHDPSFKDQRRRSASRAGRAGGRGRAGGGEISQIKGKLRKIAEDLLDPKAKLKPANAAIAVQAYNAVCNAIRTDLKQREQEELVQRMEALEGALKARKAGYGYGA